jgi:hypothetical protein
MGAVSFAYTMLAKEWLSRQNTTKVWTVCPLNRNSSKIRCGPVFDAAGWRFKVPVFFKP